MNPILRKRLDDLEAKLSSSESDVCFVPWYVYGLSFVPMVGETWEELEDRASRWLNGEDVPGPYGEKGHTKDPRTREVSLMSFENLETSGELLTKKISIGDTDSSAGVRYEEIPASKRPLKLIDQRTQEMFEQHSS